MRKSIFFLLFLASPIWAARAAILRIESAGVYTESPNPSVVRWNFFGIYEGGDVPNTLQNFSLSVSVSSSALPSKIQSDMISAEQVEAVNRGFTVPVGNTLFPSFTLQ